MKRPIPHRSSTGTADPFGAGRHSALLMTAGGARLVVQALWHPDCLIEVEGIAVLWQSCTAPLPRAS